MLESITDLEQVEFAYDYQYRRVSKQVYEWQADVWSLLTEHGYVYDGWNLIRETTTGGTTSTEYYVWGLDLSGSLQGAGGIGGLLSTTNSLTSTTYLYTVDADGNVGQLVDASNGTISAHYEYDPFGNLVVSTGSEADKNVFRFSTKYYDVETGLYYYGRRYYSLELARWMTRDPIEEDGGLNLYGFVRNNPVNYFDSTGLLTKRFHRRGTDKFTIPLISGLLKPDLSVDLWISYDCRYPGLNIQLIAYDVKGILMSGFILGGERWVNVIPHLVKIEDCCYENLFKGQKATLQVDFIVNKALILGIGLGSGYTFRIHKFDPYKPPPAIFSCWSGDSEGCVTDFEEWCSCWRK